jgi:hypothetical protein
MMKVGVERNQIGSAPVSVISSAVMQPQNDDDDDYVTLAK